MTYPQTSPPPTTPAYPATVPGRRIFMDKTIGVPRSDPNGDGIRLSDEAHAKMQEMLKNPPFDLNEAFKAGRLAMIPYEKLEGPEFPLDLLVTDDVTYVGNEKHWPQPIDYDVQKELDKPESIFYNSEEKRWDDNVGQYPPQNSVKSNEEFLEYLKDLAERQRLLLKGLFLLKSYGTDFVGRAGEL